MKGDAIFLLLEYAHPVVQNIHSGDQMKVFWSAGVRCRAAAHVLLQHQGEAYDDFFTAAALIIISSESLTCHVEHFFGGIVLQLAGKELLANIHVRHLNEHLCLCACTKIMSHQHHHNTTPQPPPPPPSPTTSTTLQGYQDGNIRSESDYLEAFEEPVA